MNKLVEETITWYINVLIARRDCDIEVILSHGYMIWIDSNVPLGIIRTVISIVHIGIAIDDVVILVVLWYKCPCNVCSSIDNLLICSTSPTIHFGILHTYCLGILIDEVCYLGYELFRSVVTCRNDLRYSDLFFCRGVLDCDVKLDVF